MLRGWFGGRWFCRWSSSRLSRRCWRNFCRGFCLLGNGNHALGPGRDSLFNQQIEYAIAGLGADGQPILDPILFQHDRGRCLVRINCPDLFEIGADGIFLAIGNNDPVGRVIFLSDAGETDDDH